MSDYISRDELLELYAPDPTIPDEFGCIPQNDAPLNWDFPEIELPACVLPIQLDNGAFLPIREHSTDGGLDLKSPIDCYIQPGDSAAIDTGVSGRQDRGRRARG